LVIAIIAGVLGFGGIAGAATGIAKILFWIFLVLVLLALIFGRRTWCCFTKQGIGDKTAASSGRLSTTIVASPSSN